MRYDRSVLSVAVLTTAFILLPSYGSAQVPHGNHAGAHDADFSALQERGEKAMGVDQYSSTHRFDALPDGGRIEFQRDVDDAAGIEVIRAHLKEIQFAFSRGDFSTPAFVHSRDVPGTEVMASLRSRIEYVYRDLPRGGELRLQTSDPAALEAIHAFMAFQRTDHRAGGTDRAAADETAHSRHSGGGDAAFAADMDIVHELLMNHRAITRTVEHLPDGIRTLTESTSPRIASVIVAHVKSMESRLEEGAVFNLSSHTLPTIFENYKQIRTEIEYSANGVTLVQTSDDPAIVAALQAHAAEVTGLVDEGMIAMMRSMMTNGRQDGMQGMRGMMGGMRGGMQGNMHGGMHAH